MKDSLYQTPVLDAVNVGENRWVVPKQTVKTGTPFDSSVREESNPDHLRLIRDERSFLRRWRMRFGSENSKLYLGSLASIGATSLALTFIPAYDLLGQIFANAIETPKAGLELISLYTSYKFRNLPQNIIAILDANRDSGIINRDIYRSTYYQ